MVLLLATTWTTLPKGSAWADTNNKVICSQEGFNLCQQPDPGEGLDSQTGTRQPRWGTGSLGTQLLFPALSSHPHSSSTFSLFRGGKLILDLQRADFFLEISRGRCPWTPKIPPQVVWFSNGLSICSCQLQPNIKGTLNTYRIKPIVSRYLLLFICLFAYTEELALCIIKRKIKWSKALKVF